MNPNKPILNNVKNRFLPIPEAVAKCLEPEPKITDFDIIKELGAGSFGHVYLVVHKVTKVKYAIKAIDKRNKTNIEEKPYFRREIEIMYKIHHPNVVRLFSHFEDDNYCYFIMEYISKGNIYNLIPKDRTKKLSNQMVASIMKDVISAVYFLHNMNPPIIHRDIKPENVLLAEGKIAKLTDFGWSNYMQGGEKRTTVCGTPIYLAPEIVNETGHDEKVDLWCLGVLLFELSTGSMPFLGNDLETLKSNIRHMKIAWPRDINSNVKNLIMRILKYDPKARISLEEMLNHPFFKTFYPDPSKFLIKPDENMQTFPFIVSKHNPENDPNMVALNKIVEKEKSPEKKYESPKKEAKIINLTSDNKGKKTDRPIRQRDISPVPFTGLHLEKLNISKLHNIVGGAEEKDLQKMKEKYESLVVEYNKVLKQGGTPVKDEAKIKKLEQEVEILTSQKDELAKEIVHLKKQLLDKNGKHSSQEQIENETELQIQVKDLETENEILKEKLAKYEEAFVSKKSEKFETAVKEIRDSLSGNNNDRFIRAVEKFRGDMDEETKHHFIMILNEKDKELQRIKDELIATQQKEKKKYTSVINKYDGATTLLKKENRELREKLAKLEGK